MWIVRLALRRPYTFVVMSILILVMGALSIVRTPTDIFPNINIPVVSVIWIFNGMVPKDMSDRIVSVTERNLTTIVDNIEHIESLSYLESRWSKFLSSRMPVWIARFHRLPRALKRN
jgi:multidrug efflux pump subunit AcrB